MAQQQPSMTREARHERIAEAAHLMGRLPDHDVNEILAELRRRVALLEPRPALRPSRFACLAPGEGEEEIAALGTDLAEEVEELPCLRIDGGDHG
jgi:hypothetical protein